MPVQINNKGQWAQEYFGPYSGLNTQTPESLIPDNASPAFNNFMLRNAELRSGPNLLQHSISPAANVLGLSSFVDLNGTYHTVFWANTRLYQYDPASSPPWDIVGTAAPSNMNNNPVAYRAFLNQIWYTCLSQQIGRPKPASGGGSGGPTPITPFLAFWDGMAAAPVFTQTFGDGSTSQSVAGISLTDSPTVGGSLPGGPTVVGPLAIGGQYLGELNNQLILANVNVLDQNNGGSTTLYNFPNLMWWSANGLPKQWDPTANTSAGFSAFMDVPDLITGLATLGVAGYLFRTNGITQFSPTGSGTAPWQFNHMWASDHGIGNVIPWSIAQYGPNAAFIAEDNIYSLSLTNAVQIGGTARDAIMSDLATFPSLSGPVISNQPFATITPKYNNGFVYLTYKLYIPFSTFIREWTYSYEDKNWAPRDLPFPFNTGTFPIMLCAPNFV